MEAPGQLPNSPKYVKWLMLQKSHARRQPVHHHLSHNIRTHHLQHATDRLRFFHVFADFVRPSFSR